MKKLAIIGASYLQEPLVRKAKEMGLYTICFAWREGATCAEICDQFYPISIVEKDEILEVCQKEGIDGICTIASDVAAPTVAYIANKMGLNGNDYDASVRANNKYLMRQAFVAAGVPCPSFMVVTNENLQQDEVMEKLKALQFPVIVKPSDRSGSLGVSKVTSFEELMTAIRQALEYSFKHEAMVEEFVEGREISVEFISYHGKHYPLQITDKVTTEAPHFVELAHHQPSTLSAAQYSEIYSITQKALDALGLTEGASHSEYKITESGRIAIMEIGGRMGGDFIGSDLVQLSTGYDFVKGVVEVALGNFEEPKKLYEKHSGVYFLCEETKWLLPMIQDAANNPIVVKYEIENLNLKNVTCSADRSGYMIYQSDKKLVLKQNS